MTPARWRAVVGAGVVLALLLVGYIALAATSGSTARDGTTVAGVDISGMTEPEAIVAVDAALEPLANQKVKAKVLDSTIKVSPSEAGLSVDVNASVAPAYGSTWNPVALISGMFGGDELPPVVVTDDELLASQLDALAMVIDDPPQEPVVRVKKGEPIIEPGVPGRALDRETASALLTEALTRRTATIDIPILSAEPTVTPEAAEEALALAEVAMSAPVEVTAGTVTATIPGRAIGRALRFTAADGVLEPSLDGERLHKAIADELAPVETPGRDATFKIRRGVPKVVKSKVGKGVSDEELAAAVTAVIDKPAAERRVTVPLGTRAPALTTEEARGLGVKERLSTFTQAYPYAPYRSQNIGQAAKRINGTLLMPGETFSLNDTILERTEENGYTTGYVVGPGGVFAEDLGGGVSTSATTAWTAAFYAGLERVQTVAHSIWISRYKPGLEATVAWGIFDMKFRNDTPNAVFITAGTTPTSITVSMWGTKEYDKIEAEYGERTNIVKYKKIYNDAEECSPQGGVDGFTIVVDRVFYKDGKEVKREPITTRYKPAPQVICDAKPKKKKDKKDEAAADAPASDEGNAPPSESAKPGGKKDPTPTPEPDPGDDVFSN